MINSKHLKSFLLLQSRFGEPFNIESQEIFASIAEFVKAFKREADLILVTAGKLNRFVCVFVCLFVCLFVEFLLTSCHLFSHVSKHKLKVLGRRVECKNAKL